MSITPLLQIEDLSVSFPTPTGPFTAVDGISLQLQAGEILGVVGESGSGKSVTALSCMGLLDERANCTGAIRFKGEDLLNVTPQKLTSYRGNRLGMIFQEPMSSLNPVLSCGEQITESIRLHLKQDATTARQTSLQWLENAGLSDAERIFSSYPHELSGGQKQRVMIAMAMCCQPDILLADEPTTALDVSVQKRILGLMKDLQQRFGTAIVFISHDLGVIGEIADRVAVMQAGKIVETGTVEAVFRQPQHPYTRGLLACRPPLGKKLSRLPVIADFAEAKEKNPRKFQEQFIIPAEKTAKRAELLKQQPPILVADELSVVFRKGKKTVQAVDQVSLELYPGETLGVVGESGSGKTTLGRALLGLQPLSSGRVQYKGQDIKLLSGEALRKLRTKVQIIFQDPYSALQPRMSIGAAILEPMQVHQLEGSEAARKKRVYELLERVGLEASHYNRYPQEFSGGQRQRICIARALAVRPEFIVCDESVSALDVSVQAQVLNLLKELQEEAQLTYLFISHDLSVIQFISDRVMVMKNGQIVEQGSALDIYENPKKSYTKELISAIPATF